MIDRDALAERQRDIEAAILSGSSVSRPLDERDLLVGIEVAKQLATIGAQLAAVVDALHALQPVANNGAGQ